MEELKLPSFISQEEVKKWLNEAEEVVSSTLGELFILRFNNLPSYNNINILQSDTIEKYTYGTESYNEFCNNLIDFINEHKSDWTMDMNPTIFKIKSARNEKELITLVEGDIINGISFYNLYDYFDELGVEEYLFSLGSSYLSNSKYNITVFAKAIEEYKKENPLTLSIKDLWKLAIIDGYYQIVVEYIVRSLSDDRRKKIEDIKVETFDYCDDYETEFVQKSLQTYLDIAYSTKYPFIKEDKTKLDLRYEVGYQSLLFYPRTGAIYIKKASHFKKILNKVDNVNLEKAFVEIFVTPKGVKTNSQLSPLYDYIKTRRYELFCELIENKRKSSIEKA